MRDGVVVDDGAGPPRGAGPHRGDLTVPVPLRVDALTGRPDRAPGRQP
jgi:hypothetical protein